MHSQFELFMLPPSRNPWPLCSFCPSALPIAFLTAARMILLTKDAYVNYLLRVIQGFLVPSLLWPMRSHSVSFCSYFICYDNSELVTLVRMPYHRAFVLIFPENALLRD